MKKVVIVTSPLDSGHSVRGVGYYTRNLLSQLALMGPDAGFAIIPVASYSQVEQHQPDIIHYPFFDLFRRSLKIFPLAKTVVTVHDVIPLEFPESYPLGILGMINLRLQKTALRQVERVITDSYASVLSIRRHLSVPHEKIKLVYLGVSDAFRPIKNQTMLAEVKNKYNLPEKFVLYVGDINYNKNIPSLIKACQGMGMKLVMVGKQAQSVTSLNLNHPELAHLKNVDFTGVSRLGFVPDSDLPSIYNLATVYCQPSFSEGFGLPVLEALACGTPVALSDIGSLREIAGPIAQYFDPNNVESIKIAIRSAKNHNGPTRAAGFSLANMARGTLQVYNEALN